MKEDEHEKYLQDVDQEAVAWAMKERQQQQSPPQDEESAEITKDVYKKRKRNNFAEKGPNHKSMGFHQSIHLEREEDDNDTKCIDKENQELLSHSFLESDRFDCMKCPIDITTHSSGMEIDLYDKQDTDHSEICESNDDSEIEVQLKNAWKKVSEIPNCAIHDEPENNKNGEYYEDEDKEKAIANAMKITTSVLFQQVENLMSQGLHAFHYADSTNNEKTQMKELLNIQAREVKRLQDSDAQNRQAISNLLKALETSKSSVLSSSQASKIESQLRSTISNLRHELSLTQNQTTQYQHEMTLLKEQNKLLQSKLVRFQQEKRVMERDSRAALSLARSMDQHYVNSSDTLFYRKKVKELTDRLHDQQAVVLEQKDELEKMRRIVQRGMTQNQLEQYHRNQPR